MWSIKQGRSFAAAAHAAVPTGKASGTQARARQVPEKNNANFPSLTPKARAAQATQAPALGVVPNTPPSQQGLSQPMAKSDSDQEVRALRRTVERLMEIQTEQQEQFRNEITKQQQATRTLMEQMTNMMNQQQQMMNMVIGMMQNGFGNGHAGT
ncbi:hypothetical protein BG011_003785, partial [Mortierella polycephala]